MVIIATEGSISKDTEQFENDVSAGFKTKAAPKQLLLRPGDKPKGYEGVGQ